MNNIDLNDGKKKQDQQIAEMLQENLVGDIKDYRKLGNILADNILNKGARELLDRALKMC